MQFRYTAASYNSVITVHYFLKYAQQVDFPVENPKSTKVSDDAKDFIRSCLTPNQAKRPVSLLCILHNFSE